MIKWEELEHKVIYVSVYRAKVPGGWFILVVSDGYAETGTGVTFYPDPDHKWDGSSLD